jgi:hypothetical protein
MHSHTRPEANDYERRELMPSTNESEPRRQPERRPPYTTPGTEARGLIDQTLARLSSIDDELRVLQGFADHGAGFAAWLRLARTAAEEPTLIHRYEQCYADAWDDLDDLVTDTIEALGWREDLTELRTRNGIPEDYLQWNQSAFHARLQEMYDFVELDGLTHAFHR